LHTNRPGSFDVDTANPSLRSFEDNFDNGNREIKHFLMSLHSSEIGWIQRVDQCHLPSVKNETTPTSCDGCQPLSSGHRKSASAQDFTGFFCHGSE
jgi:hypothetical protein